MPGYGRWLLVLCLVAWGCASAPTKENLQSQAVSLNDQGYQYYRQSRFNVAAAKFAEALKLNRLIDRRVGIAANLNNLGVIAQEQDHPKQALVYFQEALEINRELHDPSGLSETLNNLGLVQLSQGRVNEAQTAYLEALDQARLLPPGPLLALSLTHLGDVARVRRDYDLALSYYHQALRVDEDRKDARGRALRWERLGRTFLDLKDYARADLYLRDALRDFRRLEDTDGLADTLQDLTRLALAQGDKPAAALNGRLLLEIYQARGQEQEAAKLVELLKAGGVGAAIGRPVAAEFRLKTRNSKLETQLFDGYFPPLDQTRHQDLRLPGGVRLPDAGHVRPAGAGRDHPDLHRLSHLQRHYAPLPAFLAAYLGSIGGITLNYLVGRYIGWPLLHKYGSYLHLNDKRINQSHRWFEHTANWPCFSAISSPACAT